MELSVKIAIRGDAVVMLFYIKQAPIISLSLEDDNWWPASFLFNATVTFSEHQMRGWHVLNLCLSFELGGVPMLLKMGQICLLLIRLALSTQHVSEAISLDKSGRKEWMLCLSANLIQPLSTTKSSRQRKSPGKFTKRFSSHCWLE